MTPDQLAAIRERDRDDRAWLTGRIWHSPTTKAAVEDRAALLAEVDRLHRLVGPEHSPWLGSDRLGQEEVG